VWLLQDEFLTLSKTRNEKLKPIYGRTPCKITTPFQAHQLPHGAGLVDESCRQEALANSAVQTNRLAMP